MSKLALLGGEKAVTLDPGDMFRWPIVNQAMIDAAAAVLRDGNMSGTDITKQFENDYKAWTGHQYALGHCNGTAALLCAMYGAGLGAGDEIIVPSITYWASCVQALNLGAAVVFADIDPDTLCIDPKDVERKITPRTKAIMVVHYMAYPADMDAILAIARKRAIKVIEDTSHAQGALYKGKLVGTLGDVEACSLMSGKSLAMGEAGILLTNDAEIYERAILFGHYERHEELLAEKHRAIAGLPLGGMKARMHQLSSAVGREQLKKYKAEIAEIDKAMNYFWDSLADIPGLGAHRPDPKSGSTKGGWYAAHGLYHREKMDNLPLSVFCDAVCAEGVLGVSPGCNKPLHTHPAFFDLDIYHAGKPTSAVFHPAGAGVRNLSGALPVSEAAVERCFHAPWFKHFRKDVIDEYAAAFRKVAENRAELLAAKIPERKIDGTWMLSRRK